MKNELSRNQKIVIGLALMIVSQLFIGLNVASFSMMNFVAGEIAFVFGGVTSVSTSFKTLNNFWQLGLSTYYPGLTLFYLGYFYDLKVFFFGVVVCLIGSALIWRGQILLEKNEGKANWFHE